MSTTARAGANHHHIAVDVEAVLEHGQASDGAGLLISSSRAILYASAADDFTDAARQATLALRDQINRHRRLPTE